MDKFTLFGVSSLLLLGFMLLSFLYRLLVLFQFILYYLTGAESCGGVFISFCLSIVLCVMLYARSFGLVQWKWYARKLGIYKQFTNIYLCLQVKYKIEACLINVSVSWLHIALCFFSDHVLQLTNCKNKFNDQLYCELQYHHKLSLPKKAFQAFCIFFRQLFSAKCIILISLGIIYLSTLLECKIPTIVNWQAFVSLHDVYANPANVLLS